MPDRKSTDIVCVLRVIEFTGPRNIVETQVEKGVKRLPNGLVIRASTIGEYLKILDALDFGTGDADVDL